jgi:hypothetical protein
VRLTHITFTPRASPAGFEGDGTVADKAPHFRKQFKRDGFMSWLERNGATLADITNPYEVVRYKMWAPEDKTRPSTHIVYVRGNETLTYTGHARQHYETFAIFAKDARS